MEWSREQIDEIVDRYRADREAILAIYQDVQDRFRYIPKEAMEQIAARLGVPLSRAYYVATFYKSLSLVPRGRFEIRVCMGTACHLKGAPRLVDAIGREVGIRPGQTSEDRLFSLETVNCLGACALAPVVVVNDRTYGEVTPDKLSKILKSYRKGQES